MEWLPGKPAEQVRGIHMQTGGEGQKVSISRVSRDTWAFNAQGGYPVYMQTDNVMQILKGSLQ